MVKHMQLFEPDRCASSLPEQRNYQQGNRDTLLPKNGTNLSHAFGGTKVNNSKQLDLRDMYRCYSQRNASAETVSKQSGDVVG